MEILILTILRLTVPLLIFRFPLLGIFAAMYLDLQDYNYLSINNDQDMVNYQTWDKFLDTYYLGIAFITSLAWKEKIAKKLSIILFSWRFIGFLVLLFIHHREFLIAFPNIFENFFIFYLLFKKFSGGKKLFTSTGVTAAIIASIAIPKLIAEYYLHVLLSPPVLPLSREVENPFLPTSQENFVLYVLYLTPTIAVLLWRLKIARDQKE